MATGPFVTITNLVEYATTSSASRRRQIIEQYHNPQLIRFDWHGASDAIFTAKVCRSEGADDLIDAERQRLRSHLLSDDDEKKKRAKHIFALVELLETSDLEKVAAGALATSAALLPADIQCRGLTIRYRPSVVLRRRKEGKKYSEFGIAKCHNLSSYRLESDVAKLYATALNMYAEKVIANCDIQPDLCRIYDLYADAVFVAPKGQKRLRALLNDAIDEISDRWFTVGERLVEKRRREGKWHGR